MTILNTVTINVRSLRDQRKRSIVFNWCRKSKFHIVFLQEVFSSKRDEKLWEKEWRSKIVWSHESYQSRSVVILFSKDNELSLNETPFDSDGCIVADSVSNEDEKFWLLNIYVSNLPVVKQNVFIQLENFI